MHGRRGWAYSALFGIPSSVPPETLISINCGAVVTEPDPSEESAVWVTKKSRLHYMNMCNMGTTKTKAHHRTLLLPLSEIC